MDLSDDEVQQHAEADRREIDPPMQVETAAWSRAGQLDSSLGVGLSGPVVAIGVCV
jgi:hypothetical protein